MMPEYTYTCSSTCFETIIYEYVEEEYIEVNK